MTYVFILSDYGEYGAENVCATLDRGQLMNLLDINWPAPVTPPDYTVPKPFWKVASHNKWMDGAKAGLAKILFENTDDQLAKGQKWECHSGWGGVQLHVVSTQ